MWWTASLAGSFSVHWLAKDMLGKRVSCEKKDARLHQSQNQKRTSHLIRPEIQTHSNNENVNSVLY